MYKEKLDEYIDSHVDDMLRDIMRLIRIPSVKGAPEPGCPFGRMPAAAVLDAEKMLAEYGFRCYNYDNYVVTADLNELAPRLDILAHLDVVPAEDNWSVTTPFEPVVKDGVLYGRGSADDKGPAVAALYAMRAVKELGIPLKGNVRIILGSDEECGSDDIAYYYKKEKAAPMTVSPDAEFPLVNIEKGILHGEFCGKAAVSEKGVVWLRAGTGINVVPDTAKAGIKGFDTELLREVCAQAAAETEVQFTLDSGSDGETVITASGHACHAATPAAGCNALTGLLRLLSSDRLSGDANHALFAALSQYFPHGVWDGESLGINMHDELSGGVDISLTKLSVEDGNVKGGFDCRSPLCATDENLRDVVKQKLAGIGLTLGDRNIYKPHHVSETSEFVQTLLRCYELYSGKHEKPLCIGGGTYVHSIENGVAFGCASLAIDNRMHGADEFAIVDQLVMSAKIYAQAIVELCG